MSLRSVTLGLLLAVFIASVTYFNDFVIHQTMFIATHLPVAVFGLLLVGLLAAGPVLGRLGVRRMSPGEVAVVVALGLAACAWPGSGFWRYTAGLVAMPTHLVQTEPSWQSRGVMSYVPEESGALLDGGVRGEASDRIIYGRPGGSLFAFDAIDWRAWSPTLTLWVGSALSLGLASLCLAMVVHPQWARRELLPYPIARFVTEAAARDPGRRLPAAAYHKWFWIGLGGVLGVHLLNGLHEWFQTGVYVDLTLPMGPLRQVFPDASRVALSHFAFNPRLYFTVIAFAFFLPRSVSFSIGIAHYVYLAIGAVLVANGVSWGYEKTTPSKVNFLRLGAFVGMALMILYTGRRYYFNVAASAVGAARLPETPRYAPWAARAAVVCLGVALWLFVRGGLDWDLAVMLIALFMLSWLVLSRIVCETGAFFVTAPFYPATALAGLLGFEAMGPTGFLMVALASWMILADPREALMPFVATGLQVLDRGGVRVGRGGGWLAVAVVVSMVVAGGVTLGLQHRQGLLSMGNNYATRQVPSFVFNALAGELADAEAEGTLASAATAESIQRFASIRMYPHAGWWLGIGGALVIGCAAMRLRLAWWPIHPVLFVMWGTYGIANFAFSFLIGWLVKSAVLAAGGARAYHTVRPLMVGLIAGELLAVLAWAVIGAAYYLATGLPPVNYTIFPG